MVDTVRTIAQLLTIFADNTTGAISPQDMRDFVVTMEDRSPVSTIAISTTANLNGLQYLGGMYDAPAADSNLTQASTTQAYGTANQPYAAHVFAVIGGVPATDATNLTLTITGASITDAGVRNGADTEVIINTTPAALSTDQYFESSKKWLGTVTYTLSSSGATNFNLDFNYGFCKYCDFGNRAYDLDGFEFEFKAIGTETSFDIELLHHNSTGWTYSAAAFKPGNTALYQLTTDYATDNDMAAGDHGFYKRSSLSDAIAGDVSEGLIARVTTTATNRIDFVGANLYIKPSA